MTVDPQRLRDWAYYQLELGRDWLPLSTAMLTREPLAEGSLETVVDGPGTDPADDGDGDPQVSGEMLVSRVAELLGRGSWVVVAEDWHVRPHPERTGPSDSELLTSPQALYWYFAAGRGDWARLPRFILDGTGTHPANVFVLPASAFERARSDDTLDYAAAAQAVALLVVYAFDGEGFVLWRAPAAERDASRERWR